MKNKFKIIILLSTFCFLFSLHASAASLNLVSPVSEIGVGRKFYVDLMLDSEGDDVNAAQGIVNFPNDILKFDSLNDGDSVITFWAEKPQEKQATSDKRQGEISFSGVIPGGFNGVLSPYYQGARPGKILRLYFIARAEGNVFIRLTNVKILLNDGQGTEAPLTISNLRISAQGGSASGGQISNTEAKDTESPEDFLPQITNDPNLFSGKYVLVWNAKDKGSGIDHYEVAEQRGSITQDYTKLPWQTAESSYLLKDQSLKSFIYVKAVDRAGNIRIVYLLPSHIPWYKNLLVDIIIGLAALIMILLGMRLRKRFLEKKH